ncbi:MAG: AAA family ATPase [Gammaproteobacteria bacterium]|jgi:AAA+ ATPase superfamily predicted ATPase|nr:AAA family ATPase [Gammaproteobacteria bacterium]
MSKIIGRKKEQLILREFLVSKKAEFLALYGRRRVGKTYLIKNYFDNTSCIFLHCTGLQKGKLHEQLNEFYKQVGATFYRGVAIKPQEKWLDAFEDLTKAVNELPKKKKVVIFFDEFPWMATPRSGLLQALDYYWNRYWVHDHRFKLIICGSSASWIIKKIINNKGGLHNRVTRTIQLGPFDLSGTKLYLDEMGIKLNHKQLLELYMVFGGVPHYLNFVRKGLSAQQCIDEVCFQKNGPLVKEFDRLFSSLFKNAKIYIEIIKEIAKHRYGIGQADLLVQTKISEGGRAISRLNELEEVGFISNFIPYGHQEKGKYYKVIDEYILFYLYWIAPHLRTIQKLEDNRGYWFSKSQLPAFKSWAGYTFEAVCYKHLSQIRHAINVDPGAQVGTWRYIPKKADEIGTQIDLLFDRSDGAITICEMKYTGEPFAINKEYAKKIDNKIEVFRKHTKTHKQIFFVLVSAAGMKETMYSEEISQCITLENLFESLK